MHKFAAAMLILIATATGAFADPADFDQSVGYVLKSEGGYTNNPSDPGGPTRYGITIYDVRKYLKAHATAADVRALTRDQAIDIYRSKYWAELCVRADDLAPGLDYKTFSYGVLAGTARVGKVLRSIIGLPAKQCTVTDGVVAALKTHNGPSLIKAMSAEQRQFFDALVARRPASATFLRGWLNRNAAEEKIALRMATPGQGFLDLIDPIELEVTPGKAWIGPPER